MYLSPQLLGSTRPREPTNKHSSYQNAGYSIWVFKNFPGWYPAPSAGGGDPLPHPTPSPAGGASAPVLRPKPWSPQLFRRGYCAPAYSLVLIQSHEKCILYDSTVVRVVQLTVTVFIIPQSSKNSRRRYCVFRSTVQSAVRDAISLYCSIQCRLPQIFILWVGTAERFSRSEPQRSKVKVASRSNAVLTEGRISTPWRGGSLVFHLYLSPR